MTLLTNRGPLQAATRGAGITYGPPFLCVVLFFFLASDTLPAYEPDFTKAHDPEHVLVRFRKGTPQASKDALHARAGRQETIETYHRVDELELVRVAPGQVEAACREYMRSLNVVYAEPDYEFSASTDDPLFVRQWNMHNTGGSFYQSCTAATVSGKSDADIDGPEAWAVWTGDPTFRIAVLDSGIRLDHEDLAANIWTNPGESGGGRETNGIDDDGNGYKDDVHGYSFLPGVPSLNDVDFVNGHGTHVAGIIGAIPNNNKGVTGVIPQCKLVVLKVFDCCTPSCSRLCTNASKLVAAFQYVINNGITVSNFSGGGCGYSQAIFDIIHISQSAGNILVAAAGNLGQGCAPNIRDNDAFPFYPASYSLENIIAVANTDKDDLLWPSSHYGATSVDLGAPGTYITSTGRDNVADMGWYKCLSGTSMAAPHVTGIVALVRSLHPDWTWAQIRHRVLWTARPVAALAPNGPTPTATGGVVNAYAALWDCNGNGINDACDISCNTQDCVPPCGTSIDSSGNGTPDECESGDCNNNSMLDSFDIAASISLDCNRNEVPDECELLNGAPDCNMNRIPDECDIATGRSCDIDFNVIPDECFACCDADYQCSDRPYDECVSSHGTPHPGAVCGECSCYFGACCCCGSAQCHPGGGVGCECQELQDATAKHKGGTFSAHPTKIA